MFSRFFIDRPIFAAVLSIVITLAGGIAVFSGMIGVTLFGIFLTPVFFYVIDWLGEAHVFRSRGLRRAVDVALDVLTLGLRRVGPAIARWRGGPLGGPTTNGPGGDGAG